MRLIEVLDTAGRSRPRWVNVDHVVGVAPIHRDSATGIVAEAEVTLAGMPPLRIVLGEHATAGEADDAFREFLRHLQQN